MDDLFVETVIMLERVQAASLAELNGRSASRLSP
jgi:hypothetical protein